MEEIKRIQNKRARIERAFSVCGTPEYMSPEVIAERGHDMLSDWWSLGIVMYELATGFPPFADRNLEIMAENIQFGDLPTQPHFSAEFESLLLGLTSKVAEQRLGCKGAN